MATIGEQVIARLDALERTVTNLQTRTSDANTQRPVEMGEMQTEFDELRQQVALVRSQLESSSASGTFGPKPPHNGTFQKEMMPEVLGNAYKENGGFGATKPATGLPSGTIRCAQNSKPSNRKVLSSPKTN